MAFYSGLQGTANRLLKKYGAEVIIKRVIKGAYDWDTGRPEPETEMQWKTYALKTGISENFLAGYSILGSTQGGTKIQVGDMTLIVGITSESFVPQAGDLVTFADGEIWSILADMPVKPAEVTVLYKGLIRKG